MKLATSLLGSDDGSSGEQPTAMEKHALRKMEIDNESRRLRLQEETQKQQIAQQQQMMKLLLDIVQQNNSNKNNTNNTSNNNLQ
jgi:hypothetical protein